ncbi:GNAT family N-acetyltransferase [Desulforhopalus vacuolatus]|uniref:GNAT family N-acetyltransferase n=1 Tax=Desulforhopalus vacuolatus TaxID=40414 RepID=UPI001966AFD3|nr:GNAT family protein [Desulforhopalus vacuolatus]MBM9520041.1 GNAT family N-acetyltransferase [Desulforhopalus vacuolatus]
MAPVIEGDNLYLRKLVVSDLNRTWEWLHRRDIYSKIGVQVPFTKEQQFRWFGKLQNDDTKIVCAICRNIDQIHIGNVSLDMIDLRHRNARLSIFIANPAARGQGYGSEALTLQEQYAFFKLKLHKIWCKTDAGHPEVLHFYERLGYLQEGLLREHEVKDGQFVDKVILAKFEIAKVLERKSQESNSNASF